MLDEKKAQMKDTFPALAVKGSHCIKSIIPKIDISFNRRSDHQNI